MYKDTESLAYVITSPFIDDLFYWFFIFDCVQTKFLFFLLFYSCLLFIICCKTYIYRQFVLCSMLIAQEVHCLEVIHLRSYFHSVWGSWSQIILTARQCACHLPKSNCNKRSICLSIYLSFYLSIHQCLSIYLSISIYIYISISISIYIYIYILL